MNVTPPRTFSDLVGFSLPDGPLAHQETHGTTVLALRYKEGALLVADRRATMGNLIMYDHADKVLPLDDSTVVAISGSFARSIEVCRMLQHSFKYYRRMHLNEMSMEGKLQEISRALAQNMPMAMQGIGIFVPILASFDRKTDKFQIHFFDTAGARFIGADYACAGSGSERIRGIFEFISRTEKPWHERALEPVMMDALRMLDIAADLDSATGGFSKILPAVFALDRNGVRAVDERLIEKTAKKILGSN